MTTSEAEPSRLVFRRRLFATALGIAVALTVISVWYRRSQPKPPRLPKPNGFHAFVVAGRAVIVRGLGFREMSLSELQGLVQTNARVIECVQEGLRHHSQISHAFDADYSTIRLQELMRMRDAARTLVAAAHLAMRESRFEDAAEMIVTTARFGHEATRGGTMIDRLIGLRCEGDGFREARNMTNALPSEACRRLVRGLEMVDATRETLEEVREHEAEWHRHGETLREQVNVWLSLWSDPFSWAFKSVVENFPSTLREADRERRALMIHFAARAYELEQGKPPGRASDLVPGYLKAVPKDPETSHEMPLKPR